MRERQHPTRPLILEIERRGTPKRRQQRIARERTGRHVDEPLRELERLRPLVAIQAEHEVGLHVRDVAHDHVHVIRDLLHLLHPFARPRPALVV